MDTTGKACSVALFCNDRIISERYINIGHTHSEMLMPLLDGCLQDAGADIDLVDAFAVSVGPGSFTGVRIGVLTAKGLSHATGKPLIALDTLELLKENICAGAHEAVCPILDARRGQVYAAAFKNGKRILEDTAAPIEDILKALENEQTVFLGDGVLALKECISAVNPNAKFAPENLLFQRAGAGCNIAYEKALKGDFTALEELKPNYLRDSQAEQKKQKVGFL